MDLRSVAAFAGTDHAASLCRYEAQESVVTSRFEVSRGRELSEVS